MATGAHAHRLGGGGFARADDRRGAGGTAGGAVQLRPDVVGESAEAAQLVERRKLDPPARHRSAGAGYAEPGNLGRAHLAWHRRYQCAGGDGVRCDDGAALWILRRLVGRAGHAAGGHSALVSVSTVGDRGDGAAKTHARQPDPRIGAAQLGGVRAHGARLCVGSQAARVRRGDGCARSNRSPDHYAPYHAQRDRAHHRDQQFSTGGADHRRVVAEFPGIGRTAADAKLGRHAEPGQRVPDQRVVAGSVPGAGDHPDSAGYQPVRRRATGRHGPEAESVGGNITSKGTKYLTRQSRYPKKKDFTAETRSSQSSECILTKKSFLLPALCASAVSFRKLAQPAQILNGTPWTRG